MPITPETASLSHPDHRLGDRRDDGTTDGLQEQLFYEFRLEDWIPVDHLLRKICAISTASQWRAATCDYATSAMRAVDCKKLIPRRSTAHSSATAQKTSRQPIQIVAIAPELMCAFCFWGGKNRVQSPSKAGSDCSIPWILLQQPDARTEGVAVVRRSCVGLLTMYHISDNAASWRRSQALQLRAMPPRCSARNRSRGFNSPHAWH